MTENHVYQRQNSSRFILDLEPLAKQIADWMPTRQIKGEPLGVISQVDNKEDNIMYPYETGMSVFGPVSQIYIKYILDMLDFDDKTKDLWADAINRFQDPKTGLYCDNDTDMYIATADAVGALELIERKPKYPLSALHETRAKIEDWLESRIWVAPFKPMHAGVDAGALVSALMLEGHTPMSWFHRVVEWFDKEQDPYTGLWRKGLIDAKYLSKYHRLGFHILAFIYEPLKQPVRYASNIIDSVLRVRTNGEFYDAWEDGVAAQRPGVIKGWICYDGLYCLSRASRVAQDRRSDAIEAAEKLADLVLPKFADPSQFSKNLFDTFYALGCVNVLPMLQELVPHRLKGRRLKNILDRTGVFM